MRPSLRLLLCSMSLMLAPWAGAQAPPPQVPEAAQPEVWQAFQSEAARLDKALQGAFTVVVLNTDDPTFRTYIASGIYRLTDAAYQQRENGLSAALIPDGQHNGQAQAVCYILYRPQEAGSMYRMFYQPLAAVGGPSTAGAMLMGHEVGHCLDQYERLQRLPAQPSWTAEAAQAVGLAAPAFHRVFGATLAGPAYRQALPALFADLAQRQYEERVADAFALLWVWRLGGSDRVMPALVEARRYTPAGAAHATVPVFALDAEHQAAVAQSQTLLDLWVLARQVQQAAGVDASLGEGSTAFHNPAVDPRPASNVPASAPPVASPSTPGSAQPPGTLTTPQSIPFNRLPRFGGSP